MRDRVYFVRRGDHWLPLLVGSKRSTQARDIKKAKELARRYVEQRDDQDNHSSLGSR